MSLGLDLQTVNTIFNPFVNFPTQAHGEATEARFALLQFVDGNNNLTAMERVAIGVTQVALAYLSTTLLTAFLVLHATHLAYNISHFLSGITEKVDTILEGSPRRVSYAARRHLSPAATGDDMGLASAPASAAAFGQGWEPSAPTAPGLGGRSGLFDPKHGGEE